MLIEQLRQFLKEDKRNRLTFCADAGISSTMVGRWLGRATEPKLALFEAALNTAGYKLKIVRIEDD